MEELAGYGISRPFTVKSQRFTWGFFFSNVMGHARIRTSF